MTKRITQTAAALTCIALLHGCKKDEVSQAPVISIENLSAYSVVEYNNAIDLNKYHVKNYHIDTALYDYMNDNYDIKL